MTTLPQPPNAPSQRRLVLALACAPFVAWLAWLGVATRFLCDDAFITFRYARHLADGDGLVFNSGEHVEGFVNLLWTLELLAAGATAHLHAFLRVPTPTTVEQQPFVLVLRVQPDVPDAALTTAPIVLELPLTWRSP